MSLILLVVLIISICSFSDAHLSLSILPPGRDVIMDENADLNLTCHVNTKKRPYNARYDLTWKLPTRSNANGDRITVYQENDHLTVTIHRMQEDDTGVYVCSLQDQGIMWSRKISVFVKTKKCIDPLFNCGAGLCIPKYFICDGYVDCPTGYDEAPNLCGTNPCHDKMLCDGRCIPRKLCCDINVDPNCTQHYVTPCCRHNSPPEAKAPSCSTGECRYMGNSVLYIVASCAGVVMVVSTVILFVAWRICSRQDYQRWSPGYTPAARDSDSNDNLDFFDDIASEGYYHGNTSSDSGHVDENFVLMDFVPGHGFRVAECRPKPPPYTENGIGYPPPPYDSRLDLTREGMRPGVAVSMARLPDYSPFPETTTAIPTVDAEDKTEDQAPPGGNAPSLNVEA